MALIQTVDREVGINCIDFVDRILCMISCINLTTPLSILNLEVIEDTFQKFF